MPTRKQPPRSAQPRKAKMTVAKPTGKYFPTNLGKQHNDAYNRPSREIRDSVVGQSSPVATIVRAIALPSEGVPLRMPYSNCQGSMSYRLKKSFVYNCNSGGIPSRFSVNKLPVMITDDPWHAIMYDYKTVPAESWACEIQFHSPYDATEYSTSRWTIPAHLASTSTTFSVPLSSLYETHTRFGRQHAFYVDDRHGFFLGHRHDTGGDPTAKIEFYAKIVGSASDYTFGEGDFMQGYRWNGNAWITNSSYQWNRSSSSTSVIKIDDNLPPGIWAFDLRLHGTHNAFDVIGYYEPAAADTSVTVIEAVPGLYEHVAMLQTVRINAASVLMTPAAALLNRNGRMLGLSLTNAMPFYQLGDAAVDQILSTNDGLGTDGVDGMYGFLRFTDPTHFNYLKVANMDDLLTANSIAYTGPGAVKNATLVVADIGTDTISGGIFNVTVIFTLESVSYDMFVPRQPAHFSDTALQAAVNLITKMPSVYTNKGHLAAIGKFLKNAMSTLGPMAVKWAMSPAGREILAGLSPLPLML